jgi:hypothetical protein
MAWLEAFPTSSRFHAQCPLERTHSAIQHLLETRTVRQICEHAVSFAQYNGKIEQFLEWRRKSKSSTNVTELVMSGLVSGKKGPKYYFLHPFYI